MVFCSNCGKDLPEDAYFCPRCAMRTSKGIEAGIATPWEDLKEAFSKMGEEIEKGFTVAGKEMEKAFKTARDKIREATSKEPTICAKCGEENLSRAKFCYKCGQKLAKEST
jgi:predicted amidophosphoribosyltransferase